MMEFRTFVSPALSALLILSSACAGDNEARAPVDPTRARRELHLVSGHDRPSDACVDATASGHTVTVVARESFFAPGCLVVGLAQAVVLRNDGRARHNLSIQGSDIDVDAAPGTRSVAVPVGERLAPGSYEFACRYHAAGGMVGRVTVR